MKKNEDILRDENTILNSYKIDLQNKKSQLITELKIIKKEKEKNNKPDTKKAHDLILEKIYKPDISLLLMKENRDDEDATVSKPLAEKERIVTIFNRYEPLAKQKKELETDNNIEKKEDKVDLIPTKKIDYKKEVDKVEEKNIDEIDDIEETKPSVPLAEKERIITIFNRYSPIVKKEENENLVNDAKNNYDEKMVAEPFFEVKEITKNDVIDEIAKIENAHEDENFISNNNQNDFFQPINDKNFNNNINQKSEPIINEPIQNNVYYINDKNINDLYPLSYRELLKRKGNTSNYQNLDSNLQKIYEQVDDFHNQPIIQKAFYNNSGFVGDKVLFTHTDDDFATVVEWVKYNSKKNNKNN